MKKRYQIFVSSTYLDLVEERAAVIRSIQEMGNIPACMEFFQAGQREKLDVMKKEIESSDFFFLVLGWTYGSTDSDGISYTEHEYNYAKERNMPIVAFLHNNQASRDYGKVERDQKAKASLERLRQEVLDEGIVKTWSNKDDLALHVTQSISYHIQNSPAFGWVRGELAEEKIDPSANNQQVVALDQLAQAAKSLSASRKIKENFVFNLSGRFNHWDADKVFPFNIGFERTYRRWMDIILPTVRHYSAVSEIERQIKTLFFETFAGDLRKVFGEPDVEIEDFSVNLGDTLKFLTLMEGLGYISSKRKGSALEYEVTDDGLRILTSG